MNLVERVKNILLQPKSEWEVIAGESTSVAELYTGYILLLAAIGPLASSVGMSLVGIHMPFMDTFRVPLGGAIASALTNYVLTLAGVFVVALIIDALAPAFGGEKNQAQALKVAAYSSTPSWLAGVVLLVPMLGIVGLLAALYGLYLLYLGLPRLMKAPQEKAAAYTAVVVVVAVVVMMVIGGLSNLFITPPTLPMGGIGSGMGGG